MQPIRQINFISIFHAAAYVFQQNTYYLSIYMIHAAVY